MARASGPVSPETLHGEAYFDDPWPVWERMRHEQPLFHDTIADRWLLTRYDDVAGVFREHETYSTKPYKRIFSDVIGPTMVEMDGPDHDIRRAIVAPEMVGRKLQTNYLALIDAVVEELIAALPPGPRVDLIGSFSAPLPLKVVASVLGMEAGDGACLKETTDRIIASLAGEEPARSDGIAAHQRLAQRLAGLIGTRLASPGRDLISGIAHGRTEAGEQLSRAEIASFISLLLVAGGETTDRGLANLWFILLQHPDVLEAVTADPALVDPAFSEFMRRDGVLVYEDREVERDVEWHGRVVPAGAIVRVAVASANNDETVFAEPRRFDLDRADLHLGKEHRGGLRVDGVAGHLGFGLGKHFCIGYQLARAEIVAGTRRLLEHLERPRLARDPKPHLAIRWMHRYVDRLVIEHG
ncbi:cytochrome P450 [soil metagenome]